MIPKLTDFTVQELDFAIAALVNMKTENYSQDDIKYQWLTKLTEALQEVQRQDRINSN